MESPLLCHEKVGCGWRDTIKYQVDLIDEKNGWLFLSLGDSNREPKPFILLIKQMERAVGGKVFSVGNMRYQISAMPYDIVFQWDTLFGIVIDYGKEEKENIICFLRRLQIVA